MVPDVVRDRNVLFFCVPHIFPSIKTISKLVPALYPRVSLLKNHPLTRFCFWFPERVGIVVEYAMYSGA